MEDNKNNQQYSGISDNPFFWVIILAMLGSGKNQSFKNPKIDFSDPDWQTKMLADLGLPVFSEEDHKTYINAISKKFQLIDVAKFLNMPENEYYANKDYYPEVLQKFYDIKDILLPVIDKEVEEAEVCIKELESKYNPKKEE